VFKGRCSSTDGVTAPSSFVVRVMPFVVPTFNISCNVKTVAALAPALFVAPWRLTAQPCALVFGRRTQVPALKQGATFGTVVPVYEMSLLVPALTDLRGFQSVGAAFEVVECPAGSGRFYWCSSVDDIGKGYSNEHRSGLLVAVPGSWTPPYA